MCTRKAPGELLFAPPPLPTHTTCPPQSVDAWHSNEDQASEGPGITPSSAKPYPPPAPPSAFSCPLSASLGPSPSLCLPPSTLSLSPLHTAHSLPSWLTFFFSLLSPFPLCFPPSALLPWPFPLGPSPSALPLHPSRPAAPLPSASPLLLPCLSASLLPPQQSDLPALRYLLP